MKQALITLAETYADHKGLAISTVSTYAAGDGKFFGKLKGRSSCTLKTAETVVQWFSNHWPADLEWPCSIARPKPAKKEAA